MTNELAQHITVEESTSIQWVNIVTAIITSSVEKRTVLFYSMRSL